MDKETELYPAEELLGAVEPRAAMLIIPSDDQRLYKIMKTKHFMNSVKHRYLHFNRVDSYNDFPRSDKNYGAQFLKSLAGNKKT